MTNILTLQIGKARTALRDSVLSWLDVPTHADLDVVTTRLANQIDDVEENAASAHDLASVERDVDLLRDDVDDIDFAGMARSVERLDESFDDLRDDVDELQRDAAAEETAAGELSADVTELRLMVEQLVARVAALEAR